jgi:hypothetical protein
MKMKEEVEVGLAKGVDQGQGLCWKIAPDPVDPTVSCFYLNFYLDWFIKKKNNNKNQLNFSSIRFALAKKEEEEAKEPLTLLL